MTFEYYLRTGRRTNRHRLETKFNPWHDPDDGRFTFAGQGRHFGGPAAKPKEVERRGFGSRGGSFGGGGASGSWADEPRLLRGRTSQGGSGGGGGGTSMRPYVLEIIWFIDRDKNVDSFPNEKSER